MASEQPARISSRRNVAPPTAGRGQPADPATKPASGAVKLILWDPAAILTVLLVADVRLPSVAFRV
jgi:hypothetical protein